MYDLIRANKRRSVLLVIAFVAVVAVIGFAFGVVFGNGLMATIVALILVGIWWFGFGPGTTDGGTTAPEEAPPATTAPIESVPAP